MKDNYIFFITICFLGFVFILHMEYIDNTITSDKTVVDMHGISRFENIKTAVFMQKKKRFFGTKTKIIRNY